MSQKKTILIIEDEKVLRDLMEDRFLQKGFKVFTAIDGTEGVKKAVKLKPNLIFLDIILPGLSGFEVLTRLKDLLKKDFAKLKIIIITNLGQKEDISKAKKLGALDYLVKANITIKDIEDKIEKYL